MEEDVIITVAKVLKGWKNKMEESLLRELIRFNDLMADYIPYELFIKWAEINDEIIAYLQERREEK